MDRKKFMALIAVITVLAMMLGGCGGNEESQPTGAAKEEVLNLTSWEMSATTWSSPNGATVHISAVPAGYVEGQSAVFTVRLEGETVAQIPCEWDGKTYTASVDLNGADGYCYYMTMTGADGSQVELEVNVPTDPIDESLINMASSLESSCSLVITAYEYEGNWLSITDGSIQVRPPRIVNEGESITCAKAEMVVLLNDVEVGRSAVEMPEAKKDGSYELALTDLAFETPAMEDDQLITVRLDVELSNGQRLSAAGGTWMYNNGQLLMGVG